MNGSAINQLPSKVASDFLGDGHQEGRFCSFNEIMNLIADASRRGSKIVMDEFVPREVAKETERCAKMIEGANFAPGMKLSSGLLAQFADGIRGKLPIIETAKEKDDGH